MRIHRPNVCGGRHAASAGHSLAVLAASVIRAGYQPTPAVPGPIPAGRAKPQRGERPGGFPAGVTPLVPLLGRLTPSCAWESPAESA